MYGGSDNSAADSSSVVVDVNHLSTPAKPGSGNSALRQLPAYTTDPRHAKTARGHDNPAYVEFPSADGRRQFCDFVDETPTGTSQHQTTLISWTPAIDRCEPCACQVRFTCDNDGIAGSYSGGSDGGGGDGRGDGPNGGDGYSYENMRTCGWPERDIADLDAIEDDDELRLAESRCLGEMQLNCNRFGSALVGQWHEMRHACSKADFRKLANSWITMEALRLRVPIAAWAPKYNLDDLQGDLIAGVTVGLTLIPQAIAYAGIAQLDPQYGLYTSFIGPFIYLVFGMSKDVALGPSAIASLMTLVYGKPLFGRDPTVAIWLALYTGIVQLIMYFVGFGNLMDFISYPVLKAFSVACSITIGMSQVKKWWGLRKVPGEFIPQLIQTVEKIPQTRLWDFILGVISIFFLVLFKKMKEYKWKTKYEDLPTKWKIVNKSVWFIGTSRNTIVIICTSIAAYIFELYSMVPFSLTGPIPPGIPGWRSPPSTITDPATNTTYTLSDVNARIGAGIIVVPLIGLVEALSIGKVCARKFNYKYDTNQEFLPFGIANVLGAFVMAYPATGTYSRTAVNAASGSRTPAGNVITGALVLLALAFLTPLFYYIPHASLGVVIIMAVIDTITFHKLWIFWKTKRIDLIPWIVTFILSFVLSIEYGILIGCIVQLCILLYDTWRPTIQVYEYEPCARISDRSLRVAEFPKLIVVELSSSLTYPAIDYIKDRIIAIGQKEKPAGVIIDFSHIADIDTSTVQGVRELLADMNKMGIKIVACCLQKRVATVFRRAKPKNFMSVPSMQDAVEALTGRAQGDDTFGNSVAVCTALAAYSAETECIKMKAMDDRCQGGIEDGLCDGATSSFRF